MPITAPLISMGGAQPRQTAAYALGYSLEGRVQALGIVSGVVIWAWSIPKEGTDSPGDSKFKSYKYQNNRT